MAKGGNGTIAKILAGIFVLVLVSYNAWLGVNIVDIREHCARMDANVKTLMKSDGTN